MGQLFFNYIVPRLDIKVFICTCTHTKNYKKHQLQQSSESHLISHVSYILSLKTFMLDEIKITLHCVSVFMHKNIV